MPEELKLTLPTIHLNGTAAVDLQRMYLDAYSAVVKAIDAVEKAACPNARDYYVQDTDAYRRALTEHAERIQKLVQVRNELNAILDHVTDEMLKRSR